MFKRIHFTFATTADKALASLDQTVSANPGFGLAIDASGRIKLFRNQGFALLNGFFPVFVGRFGATANGAQLEGGFRFHLLAIGLFAGFVGTSAFSLIDLLRSPPPAGDIPVDWKSQRIRFEMQFMLFAMLSAFFAWLAGKPMRDRITAMIAEAARRTATEKSGSG